MQSLKQSLRLELCLQVRAQQIIVMIHQQAASPQVNRHSRNHPKYAEGAVVEENVISVMGKVSEQIISLVLALTQHTIVGYVEATVNVPLVMEQGSKAKII